MKIKANLLNKPVNFQMDDCQIEKVVELPRDQFSALVITPLTNQPFIAENKRWMFADDSAVHCLLVLGQGSGDGVLIYSAGYDYQICYQAGGKCRSSSSFHGFKCVITANFTKWRLLLNAR